MATGPQPLGLKRSFGFGDRLGVGTPGHIAAARGQPFAAIFAQQSIREMTRTGRTPDQVMATAAAAIEKEGWDQPWGADADHLQIRDDVVATAKAGFVFFTIDPAAHVNNAAGRMGEGELEKAYVGLVEKGDLVRDQAFDLYLGKSHDLGGAGALAFADRLGLLRAAVKYGGALAHAKRMYGWIAKACSGKPFEVEMSVDETDVPTDPLDHLFIGLELKRLGVGVVSLAPRFVGDFEKGVDYKGDIGTFEEHYRLHAALARYCGPYKISIHSGSDKFGIYPVIGRLSGELLHVKTAGTSYLEALRAICRTDKSLFKEIAAFCRDRYETDRASYHVSAKADDLPGNIDDRDLEKRYLDEETGRQIMHVTFGSVLKGGEGSDDAPFRDRIIDNLARNAGLYGEILQKHLGRHLELLLAG
jgi:hypothetical protein